MDWNEYVTEALVRERSRDLMAEARRWRAARLAVPRRPLRLALGNMLIRTGAWLLRDEYARLRA